MRSTAAEAHVNETDGSGRDPSEAGLDTGKDRSETHANLRKGKVDNSISVEQSLLPHFTRYAHVVRCSFLLSFRCWDGVVWCSCSPSFMGFFVSRQRCSEKASKPCGDLLKEFDDLFWLETLQPMSQGMLDAG